MKTEIISYSRSISPALSTESASFTVTIAAKIANEDQRDELMAIAQECYSCAAKPISRFMQLDPSRPQDAPRIIIENPVLDILSEGISIEKITLTFAQTWQIDKPYTTTIAPSCSTELEDFGDDVEPFVIAMAWQSIISTVYRAAEESLFAAGRWATRLDDYKFALK
jgi:hypothetical protein